MPRTLNLKVVAIDTPVDLEIRKLITHDESAVDLVEMK